VLSLLSLRSNAQDNYGKTLNIGLGLGGGYSANSVYAPLLTVNYEFDIARNFTLAPFITYSYYHSYYYWGNATYPYENYSYAESAIPFGVKGYYYFDQLLNAGPKWDFYGACSVGFVYRNIAWESGYNGGYYLTGMTPFYFDVHIGAEYHFTGKVGLFLDLSTQGSTVGLSIHR